MQYKKEFNIYDFEFWSGGKVWADRFTKQNKLEELGEQIEEAFNFDDDIPTETDINDYVWFDEDLHKLLYPEEPND